jgi:hypothetical protein
MNTEEMKILTLNDNFERIKGLTNTLSIDFIKLDKKVKCSGARVRQTLLDIKKLCDLMRRQVLSQVKEIPIKHRVKKTKENFLEKSLDKNCLLGAEPLIELKTSITDEPVVVEMVQPEPELLGKPKRKRRANKEKLKVEVVENLSP